MSITFEREAQGEKSVPPRARGEDWSFARVSEQH